MNNTTLVKGYNTAEARWSRLGPYYAMFPLDFAFDVIRSYSKPGESIIDPFAGRCSSIYAGGVLGRSGLGIEINPIGWIYGTAKLNPTSKNRVVKRLEEIYTSRDLYKKQLNEMPEFYRMCFSDEVLKFLIAARENLNWRNSKIDTTLTSIILVYLHGKIGEGLSNQMRMTKSMGVNYSVNWWKRNRLTEPPDINPYSLLLNKIEWRYAKGIPKVAKTKIFLGDSTKVLDKVITESDKTGEKFSLLFTSPPYYGLTDYYADQWLRLWLLGGPELPKMMQDKHKRRFASKIEYISLLDNVFSKCAILMKKKSIVYVRTDIREFTFNVTVEVLTKYFPKHKLEILKQPLTRRTQTNVYGNKSSDPGETDIILRS